MDKCRGQYWAIEINKIVEIRKNQLYFAITPVGHQRKMVTTIDALYFTIDDDLVYQNFYKDFGPLSISCLYKYCYKMKKYLTYAKNMKRVVHFTSPQTEKKANAAFLIGAFCVIYYQMHPTDVYRLINSIGPFKPFIDASQNSNAFTIKLNDCYQALTKAIAYNFFHFDDFNINEYDMYNQLQHGDLNWMVPRKLVAFMGPVSDNPFSSSQPPEFYLNYFLQTDVKCVVRLNNRNYNKKVFEQVGIDHIDLIYPDGTTPPKEILLKFLEIAENTPGAVAVHCKAGLGRTGSLIGAYLIKHFRFTAKEAIAWMRIIRSGCVIGVQQSWLEKIQPWLWHLGTHFRADHFGDPEKIPYHKYGIYSNSWAIEREKIIRNSRKRIQKTFASAELDKVKRNVVSTGALSRPPNRGTSNIFNFDDQQSANSKSIRMKQTASNVSNLQVERLIRPGRGLDRECCNEREPKYDRNHRATTQGDKLNQIKAARCVFHVAPNRNQKELPQ